MKAMVRACVQTCLMLSMISLVVASASAEPYELSKNDVMDPKAIRSPDISLFGVKIGDTEAKALDVLVNEKIPGIKVEQEALFIFLIDTWLVSAF